MTALAIAKMAVDRTTPLAELLKEAKGTPSADVPLELFLAHRAGLEAHLPLYEPLTRGERVDVGAALRAAASARRPDAVGNPPFAPVYSDLGYILAGQALARFLSMRDAGEAIELAVAESLGVELGTARTLSANASFAARVAPTEVVGWRGGEVRG